MSFPPYYLSRLSLRDLSRACRGKRRGNPDGYLLELTSDEWLPLKSQFATSIKGEKVKLPTAFTERGLYMLATILKSPQAIGTTSASKNTGFCVIF